MDSRIQKQSARPSFELHVSWHPFYYPFSQNRLRIGVLFKYTRYLLASPAVTRVCSKWVHPACFLSAIRDCSLTSLRISIPPHSLIHIHTHPFTLSLLHHLPLFEFLNPFLISLISSLFLFLLTASYTISIRLYSF